MMIGPREGKNVDSKVIIAALWLLDFKPCTLTSHPTTSAIWTCSDVPKKWLTVNCTDQVTPSLITDRKLTLQNQPQCAKLHHDAKEVHSLQSKKFNKSSVHLITARELKKSQGTLLFWVFLKKHHIITEDAGRAYRKLTSTETSAQMVVSWSCIQVNHHSPSTPPTEPL